LLTPPTAIIVAARGVLLHHVPLFVGELCKRGNKLSFPGTQYAIGNNLTGTELEFVTMPEYPLNVTELLIRVIVQVN